MSNRRKPVLGDQIERYALGEPREFKPYPYGEHFVSGIQRLRSLRTNFPLSIGYVMERLSTYLERYGGSKNIDLLAAQLDLVIDRGIRRIPHRAEDHSLITSVTIVETGLFELELPRISKGNRITQSEIYAALSLALCDRALSILDTPEDEQSGVQPERLVADARHALGMAMARHPWNPSSEVQPSPLDEKLVEHVKNYEKPTGKVLILDLIEKNESLVREEIPLKTEDPSLTDYIPAVKKKIQRLLTSRQ